MAKGNLILGTAKNSVGDVVMYRREGAQITRVRVRNVKNPKTNAQSFQRAIMAPIAKFYSPLSDVLERSFEGLSKAKSHNKFNQVNANLARANKWALPKGTGFFPLPYQLSQGTLPAVVYNFLGEEGYMHISGAAAAPGTKTIGDFSKWFISMGYKDGDVVTILLAIATESNTYYPESKQFIIDSASTATIADTFKGWNVILNAEETTGVNITLDGKQYIAGAVIVSRFDGNMWRRSTQSFAVSGDFMLAHFDEAHVAAAIASYGKTAGDGNPLVYLDGDELADGQ